MGDGAGCEEKSISSHTQLGSQLEGWNQPRVVLKLSTAHQRSIRVPLACSDAQAPAYLRGPDECCGVILTVVNNITSRLKGTKCAS
eukprot:967724-Prorocentrum_minimum.AAC.1